MSLQNSLPPGWIERLFDRFKLAYGAQKVGAMWQGMEPSEVMQAWSEQLARFNADALRKALQATIDSGKEWPPTLPEFVAMCREFFRPEHMPALPMPDRRVNPEGMRRVQQSVENLAPPDDPLFWAKHPKSVTAVRMLIRGAQEHSGLADVLANLIRDPSPCRWPQARKMLEHAPRS